ncbi:Rpn family recombination-promoting nuclease/putative transposase [Lactobacillus sp. PV037]|uniref:Rpn family recombination-promoting nuclease/putative transposase n=1 Tax=Lactobacillus sp. PV037 TaxID=2594496 RepID=UPI002240BA6F|nr:Rpn family recombination-promoting nuclease/putative transposase [Lactobacillus sp. PV037]QNQ83682.1 Rpn family recombination-promoting nuclease/putative transposase [Lactobacillus sp. PV037]
MEQKKWFGFSQDLVFGEVMKNKKFCKYVIQATIPTLYDFEIISIESQKEFKGTDAKEKGVRLDILVKNNDGDLFDIEMQNANEYNLGKRMRYYQSRMDTFALDSGSTYNELKKTYIIFLCMFDYFNQGKAIYTFHEYEDSNKGLQLDTASTKIIVNGAATYVENNSKLLSIIKLMQGKSDFSNKYIDYALEKIAQINNDPKKRRAIMEYETRLLEREQYGEQKGIKQGAVDTLALSKKIKYLKSQGLTDEEIYHRYMGNSSLSSEQLKELITLIN